MHIVFTDIDGTLLDHFTYSYEKSLPGMSILKEKKIPLVLVSSKTDPEMRLLHRELGLNTPFIFENGGGIAHYSEGEDDFMLEMIGFDVSELLNRIHYLEELLKRPIRLIKDMPVDEIVSKTGLKKETALFSKKRLASVPFIMASGQEFDIYLLKEINRELNKENLRLTKGGRFFHFSSANSSKGLAVKKVIDQYRVKWGIDNIISIAAGDSENDLSMLEAVDIPYLVRKHDNSFIRSGIENIRITEGIGPEGFTEIIKREVS